MNIEDRDGEQPIAWKAIREHTRVLSAEDQEVGVISEVLGSEAEDIFHGIVVKHGVLGHEVMVPADRVSSITTRRVTTDYTAEELRGLAVYVPEQTYHLGVVGLFRKHLGWVSEKNNDGPK